VSALGGPTVMRVAYVSEEDVQNPLAWSGLVHRMAVALEAAGIELHYVSPLSATFAPLLKASHVVHRLMGKSYTWRHEPLVVRGFARQIRQRIDGRGIDAVFCPSTIPVAQLECPQPIVTWADATFGQMQGYYFPKNHMTARSMRMGEELERAAVRNVDALIYPSRWAADSAVTDYGADPVRVHVVPLGASVTDVPTPEQVRADADRRAAGKCNILFIGVDFVRKGGDVVIDAARAMNRAGTPTEVHVVGSTPPQPVPDFVKPLGFINKFTPEGRATMNRLLAEAHFFMMPSVAETFGMAPCEANAFGVPALTTATGGLTEIIRDGRNGFSFPVGTPGQAYADKMLELLADRARYRALCETARAEYDARLNWDAAGRSVRAILEQVVERGRRGRPELSPANSNPRG
jgi:glycosyltransferase involved in cell wall biosynthesis